jgi:hypothetical protein
MRASVRARLTIGFLALAAIGSVVSVAILATHGGGAPRRSCRGFGTFLMTRAFSARSYRSREHPFRVVGQ